MAPPTTGVAGKIEQGEGVELKKMSFYISQPVDGREQVR